MFANREEAGLKLSQALFKYKNQLPLILAIPRGAVPMGKIIANALRGDLDVVLVRKIRSPDSPEFALGSVDESGWVFIADYTKNYDMRSKPVKKFDIFYFQLPSVIIPNECQDISFTSSRL